jgi:branched-chain amino acid transport system ATP-binding protein
MLEIRELDVFYGALQVLRKVSLDVKEGELVTLIGANGSGKSTLIMAISGILKPAVGSIQFEGKRIDGLSAHVIVGLGIVQVPQGRLLFPKMTVLANLEIGTRRAPDAKRKTMDQRLTEVFALFKVLGERRKQRAGTLSGGEQQMLAIARALMGSPKLLMLDEPSFGLAPIVILELSRVIKNLHANKLPILLVEQNAYMALELAGRGYVLRSSAIVARGSSEELKRSDLVKQAYLRGA